MNANSHGTAKRGEKTSLVPLERGKLYGDRLRSTFSLPNLAKKNFNQMSQYTNLRSFGARKRKGASSFMESSQVYRS